jgi:hypothetical protein
VKTKNAVVAGLFSFALGSTQAAPITIDFQGFQRNDPYLSNGANNFLNLSDRSVVNGSFVVDLEGLVDQRSSDPLRSFYSAINTGPVKSFSFQNVFTEQPFHNIGPYGGYDYFGIDAANNVIQMYANTLIETPTGITSDVFTLSIYLKPGVMLNDGYDIGKLRSNDVPDLGRWGANSQYEFTRTENLFGTNSTRKSVQYSGYLSDVSVTVSPIPEPETYAMLLAGLGLLGLTARRRRQKLPA